MTVCQLYIASHVTHCLLEHSIFVNGLGYLINLPLSVYLNTFTVYTVGAIVRGHKTDIQCISSYVFGAFSRSSRPHRSATPSCFLPGSGIHNSPERIKLSDLVLGRTLSRAGPSLPLGDVHVCWSPGTVGNGVRKKEIERRRDGRLSY